MKLSAWGLYPAALLSLLVGLVGTSCGANIQAVYEGDVRFEHCMAFDLRSEVSAPARLECWRGWLAHHTYGQTRDRLLHATKRVATLERQ